MWEFFEEQMDNLHTVWAIFYGKNYFGMSDKTEIVVTPPANPFGDTVTPEDLQEKYLTDVSGYENTGEDE